MNRLLLRCLLFGFICLATLSCRKNNFTPASQIDYNALLETAPAILTAVNTPTSSLIPGYYSALPFYYQQSTKNYPLLIALPGGGQSGNGGIDLPYVLNDGVAQLLSKNTLPSYFTVNGKSFSFIILSPQFKSYPSNADVAAFLDYARKTYRVDSTRMYMTGLSMGGIVTSDFAAAYPTLLAAIAPMSGVFEPQDAVVKCAAIAKANLPVWVFHNTNDPGISADLPRNFVTMINSHNPAIPARLTLFNASVHDSWTEAIDPFYKEGNLNVYEWMLQYAR